jgi:hypothetical protein
MEATSAKFLNKDQLQREAGFDQMANLLMSILKLVLEL